MNQLQLFQKYLALGPPRQSNYVWDLLRELSESGRIPASRDNPDELFLSSCTTVSDPSQLQFWNYLNQLEHSLNGSFLIAYTVTPKTCVVAYTGLNKADVAKMADTAGIWSSIITTNGSKIDLDNIVTSVIAGALVAFSNTFRFFSTSVELPSTTSLGVDIRGVGGHPVSNSLPVQQQGISQVDLHSVAAVTLTGNVPVDVAAISTSSDMSVNLQKVFNIELSSTSVPVTVEGVHGTPLTANVVPVGLNSVQPTAVVPVNVREVLDVGLTSARLPISVDGVHGAALLEDTIPVDVAAASIPSALPVNLRQVLNTELSTARVPVDAAFDSQSVLSVDVEKVGGVSQTNGRMAIDVRAIAGQPQVVGYLPIDIKKVQGVDQDASGWVTVMPPNIMSQPNGACFKVACGVGSGTGGGSFSQYRTQVFNGIPSLLTTGFQPTDTNRTSWEIVTGSHKDGNTYALDVTEEVAKKRLVEEVSSTCAEGV